MMIRDLLDWGPTKEVVTSQGPRLLCSATPNSEFWGAWRAKKDELKKAGVSPSKDRGEWVVNWWRPLPEKTVREKKEAIEKSSAASSDFEVPCPEGRAFLPFQRAGMERMV
jgi:hypothetical protein